MYRTCIFCSADLGANEALEDFPAGRRIAFDAWRGRLWAVCLRCRRWNLAPLEERWEPVEAAERLFRDARLRAHSANVGLAVLPDGTRLVRVGEALPGELAAWRYGDQLSHRRRRFALVAGAAVVAPLALYGGLLAAGAAGAGGALWQVGFHAWQYRESRRVVHQLDPAASPTGERYTLRRLHLNGARLLPDEDRFALELPMGHVDAEGRRHPLVLRGGEAGAVLSRAMLSVNESGGKKADVQAAVTLLSEGGGAEGFLRGHAEAERALGMPRVLDYGGWVRGVNPLRGAVRAWRAVGDSFRGVPVGYERVPADPIETWLGAPGERLPRPEALALEMALHEEAERRALEGELAELEAAWREAEEIAHIADDLLEVPGLTRLRGGGEVP